MNNPIKAIVIDKQDDNYSANLSSINSDDLPNENVLIDVLYRDRKSTRLNSSHAR